MSWALGSPAFSGRVDPRVRSAAATATLLPFAQRALYPLIKEYTLNYRAPNIMI